MTDSTAGAVGATPPAAVMQGFDTFSASGRATAIAGDTNVIGAHDRCDYTVCTSTETLTNALNISASVSAEFGFGGFDAKSEFVRKLETTSTSVVVAIYASVVSGTTVVTNPRLAAGITPPDAAGLNAFFQAYGDSYLSAITHGGEYIATYTFYSQTRAEQQSIVASLQAHGVTTSGTVSAGVTTAISQVASSETVRVSFSQQLFGFSGVPLPAQDQIVPFALGLSGRTPNTPTVVKYDTEGYEHAPGMNADVWRPVIETRDLFASHEKGSGIAAAVDALEAMLSQTTWLRGVYGAYGYTLDAQLKTRAADIDKDASTLKAFIRTMQKDPTKSYTRPALPSLAYGLPVLNVTTPAVAFQWGGDGGDAWWDVSMQTILDSAPLRQVAMEGVAYLDRITCTYGNATTIGHGGNGGKPVQPLVLEPGELISALGGRSWAYVDQLSITTTRGQQRACGGGGGDPRSWMLPPPSGAQYTVVVGFAGRAARYVDAIGAMTSTFSPATWQGESSLEAP
jgi:hypothetical protein